MFVHVFIMYHVSCLGFEVWAARKIEREKRKEWEETEESRHSIPHKSKY